jgi:hypothetical protein
MSRPLRSVALALALLFVAPTGCGPRVYPVEGVIQYDDGSPATGLAKGTVSLESVADKSNASGEIKADGTFKVTDAQGRGGISPGAYRVVVLPPEGTDRRNPPVDPMYGRYETSGLEVTVKSEPTKVTITVRRPPGAKKG